MSERSPEGSNEEQMRGSNEQSDEGHESYPSLEKEVVLEYLRAKYWSEGNEVTIENEKYENGCLTDLEANGGEYPGWPGEIVTFWYSRRVTASGKLLIRLDVEDENMYSKHIETYDPETGMWKEVKD